MKRRFTEEQIVAVLEEGQGGSIDELCRKHGISRGTYYSWKTKYKGMSVPDVKRLKVLEAENSRLKGLVADLSLDIVALKDVVSRKW